MFIKANSSIRKYLAPCSVIYRWIVGVRNFCFDHHWLRSKSYPVPVICVGNITVGGTGKTPHVEYILSLLHPRYRVAVLTRGYGRRAKGLVIAQTDSSVEEIGDEPLQLKLKYPGVTIAVDGNRCRAIEYLMALPREERPQVIVMDDGFQHRYVRPSYSIVLVDSTLPLREEKMLPLGNLREPQSALDRADCVILTKCPTEITPIEQRILKRNLNLFPHQRIFFSRVRTGRLRPLSHLLDSEEQTSDLPPPTIGTSAIVFCGIASPQSFVEQIASQYPLIDKLLYPDHHSFTPEDVNQWIVKGEALNRSQTDWTMICTEKDAIRLRSVAHLLPDWLQQRIFYQPIEIEFLEKEQNFIHLIEILGKGHKPKGAYSYRYE